ncbi:pre-mRNA-processing factor 17 [Salpingoeca rosetta]|uniref:Pre-mRNA-processing factor 17 n=1 Tax=Salpingoeca rosetta (strain ATCC 50818 / BSB-021) TaxID=946362 RepID=F2U594_SALR5|nr:pre-mRNA-processing factor 17 [Salpingoeca rosetta]EGD82810.1 pre-mRNA-processing factor 17 [Salpingoeca rosetta]|eukprot:XP_004996045.1 pre-mRNA-processing factor 17 [Salpingoeca rosetta]
MSLVDYSSSSDEDTDAPSVKMPKTLNAAPHVPSRAADSSLIHIHPDKKEIAYNPKYDELYAPQVGPANVFKSPGQQMKKNTFTGYIEEGDMSAFQFDNQRLTFQSMGYAVDPSVSTHVASQRFIGDVSSASAKQGATLATGQASRSRRRRKKKGNPGDIDDYMGPWADFEGETRVAKPSEEQMAVLDEYAKKRKGEQGDASLDEAQKAKKEAKEHSTLHIKDAYDYQGRSFLHPPQHEGIKYGEAPAKCFLPKKLIHTWPGHPKGVAAIRFFPVSAHLLLSAGMDGKIKLWEVYGQRRLIRTYHGHTAGVRDIAFNNDGTRFLSCGYDKLIRLWDTETGECLGHFTNRHVPYCVKFHPSEDKQHLFVAGTSDKKIICWDTNTGDIVQEYDRHLGAVNTITFVEEGRRMVTTSDDKSMRVWEWDIPVDIKYIADPSMHSMPSVAVHPNGKYMVAQSLDNQMLVFGARDRFRQNRKKIFKGHVIAGYACGVHFSPDGTYVVSGDAYGNLCIWDWRTTKLYTKLKAHDKVCIDVAWNPNETSKVATASWDGSIKYWD